MDKDQFYNRLQKILETHTDKDVTNLMGDINAKIGSDNTGYGQVMGTHALGVMNENGERFVELCAFNNLVIGGSIFPHKRIHKSTWISPDSVTENQIDHVCFNKNFRRSLQEVRVRRGADVAYDHHLVMAKLKLKLKRNQTDASDRRVKYNVSLLKDPKTREQFGLALENKFKMLQHLFEEEDNMLNRWQKVKETLRSTCQGVVGLKKHQQKEWITVESLTKIEDRKRKKEIVNNSRTRVAKVKAQDEYAEAYRVMKRRIRKDKKEYVDRLHQATLREVQQARKTCLRQAGQHH